MKSLFWLGFPKVHSLDEKKKTHGEFHIFHQRNIYIFHSFATDKGEFGGKSDWKRFFNLAKRLSLYEEIYWFVYHSCDGNNICACAL